MRRHPVLQLTVVVFGLVAVLVSAAHSAQAQGGPDGFALPANAKRVAEGVYDLGLAKDDGRTVQGYAFLHHPRQGAARPGHAGGGGGGGSTGSTCYAFLASGAKWGAPEAYVVDASGAAGASVDGSLTPSDVDARIATGVGAWETASGANIFGPQSSGSVNGVDESAPDNVNEVLFGPITQSGTIAATIVWGVFAGPPRSRALVEWDQIYDNDGDWTWGEQAEASIVVMDFLNIAVHEVGHAAGMGHPEQSCTEETMFAYASPGETKKQSLNAGDIAGIAALY